MSIELDDALERCDDNIISIAEMLDMSKDEAVCLAKMAKSKGYTIQRLRETIACDPDLYQYPTRSEDD